MNNKVYGSICARYFTSKYGCYDVIVYVVVVPYTKSKYAEGIFALVFTVYCSEYIDYESPSIAIYMQH